MKLIYLVNAKIPTDKAHGLQVMKMCEAFVEKGQKVELVVPRRISNIKEDPFRYYSVKKSFSIKRMPCLDFILWGSKSFLAAPIWHLQSLTFYFSSLIYLMFNKRDILYTRGNFPYIFLNDYVLEAHALPKKYNFLNKRLFKKARAIIVLTKNIKDRLVELGIDSRKILISPDSVDLDIFNINILKKEARQKLNLPLDKKIILYTGKFKTMGMDKGIGDILKSLKMLDKNIIFIAAGGHNDDIKYYSKLSEELGISERVIFQGHVGQNILAIYQKASDALLMPFPYNEHYAYYMSPLKMFEYMAGKRPIIATDLPSIREVLNENNSILVKPDNPEDLARGIKRAMEDASLAEKISQEAFLDVMQHTWIKRTEKIISFINNIKL